MFFVLNVTFLINSGDSAIIYWSYSFSFKWVLSLQSFPLPPLLQACQEACEALFQSYTSFELFFVINIVARSTFMGLGFSVLWQIIFTIIPQINKNIHCQNWWGPLTFDDGGLHHTWYYSLVKTSTQGYKLIKTIYSVSSIERKWSQTGFRKGDLGIM